MIHGYRKGEVQRLSDILDRHEASGGSREGGGTGLQKGRKPTRKLVAEFVRIRIASSQDVGSLTTSATNPFFRPSRDLRDWEWYYLRSLERVRSRKMSVKWSSMNTAGFAWHSSENILTLPNNKGEIELWRCQSDKLLQTLSTLPLSDNPANEARTLEVLPALAPTVVLTPRRRFVVGRIGNPSSIGGRTNSPSYTANNPG